MKGLIFLLLVCPCLMISDPTWSVYLPDVMYSGEYQAFVTPRSPGTLATITQPIYRNDVPTSRYFTQPPKIILSLMGMGQLPPTNGNTFVGFDVQLITNSTTNFYTIHNIYGVQMAYLVYMYLAVAQTNTDFYLGSYHQTLDMNDVSKAYSFDLPNNAGETYSNFGTNKIEMKGFLTGYKMKQGTANGMFLNFTLEVKNATFYTIKVSVNVNSAIEKIWYSRIGYDRTAIQKRTYASVFRDFDYELVNNTNTMDIYSAGFAAQNQFQYRNYLMGTNIINIAGTGLVGVGFALYYYFAQSLLKIDFTGVPPFKLNPAKAQYLMGNTFYHSIRNCTTAAPKLYYFPTNRKCYDQCPDYTMLQPSTFTCLPCHISCKSCSVPQVINKCITCDTSFRTFDSGSNRCLCLSHTYDDGVNLLCASCHPTCLSCASALKTACQSCSSALERQLNDPDSDGFGDCICSVKFYEETATGSCKSCSNGCLACTNVGGLENCSSCNSTLNLELSNGSCVCTGNSSFVDSVCILQKCGDGILTKSQQCDDNNVFNGDGCSSVCKIEHDHVCIQNRSLSNFSVCYFNGSLVMQITDIKKQPFQNAVSLSIKIDTNANPQFLKAYLTGASSIVLEEISRRLMQKKHNIRVLASEVLQIQSLDFDEASKVLKVKFEYFAKFDIQTKKIRFQPSLSTKNDQIKYFFNSPEAIVHLQRPFNKVDIRFFEKQTYEKAKLLSQAFLGLIASFWAISLIFVVIGKGNIGAEMMIVLQVAYVSLLSQNDLEIMLGGLSKYGKYTAGFNIEVFENEAKCRKFTAISLGCSLINNLNISFAVMILILLAYLVLKLANRMLNYCEEKAFVKKRHERYRRESNERTNENINPNEAQNLEFDLSSESSQAIEQNYYKEVEFIPEKVYNILLDLEYFFMFITVIIWVLSLRYTNQNTLSTIIVGTCLGGIYLSMWILWFMKYKTSNFSFVQAHKQVKAKYKEESEMAENELQPGINLRMTEPKKKAQEIKRKRFSAGIFKFLFYPLIWLGLLGIGVVLGTTESVGYVTQAVVIAWSLLLIVIIWMSQIYKEKLNALRSIINFIILTVVEIFYIISQKNMLTDSGFPVALIVFILLSLELMLNSASTFYLYTIELKFAKRKQQLKARSNIHSQIDQVQGVKKTTNMQIGGLFFKNDQNYSSLGELKAFEQTGNHYDSSDITKPNKINFMKPQNPYDLKPQNPYDPYNPYNPNHPHMNQLGQKLSRLQINEILNQSKLQKSNSFSHQRPQDLANQNIENLRLSGSNQPNSQEIVQTAPKKKLFGYDPSKDFYSPNKSLATTKQTQFSDSRIKMDFSPMKY